MLQLPNANVTQQKLAAYLHAQYFKPFNTLIKWQILNNIPRLHLLYNKPLH